MVEKLIKIYKNKIIQNIKEFDYNKYYYFYSNNYNDEVFGIEKTISENEYHLIKSSYIEKRIYSDETDKKSIALCPDWNDFRDIFILPGNRRGSDKSCCSILFFFHGYQNSSSEFPLYYFVLTDFQPAEFADDKKCAGICAIIVGTDGGRRNSWRNFWTKN